MNKSLTKVLSLISLSLLLSSCNSFFGGNFFGDFNQNSGNDGSNVDSVPSSSSYNGELIEAEDSVVYVLHNNVEKSSYQLFYQEVDWNGSTAKEFNAYNMEVETNDILEIYIYGKKVTKYTVMSNSKNKLSNSLVVKESLTDAFLTIRTNNFSTFYPYLFDKHYIPFDDSELDYICSYILNENSNSLMYGDLNNGKGYENIAPYVTFYINNHAHLDFPLYIFSPIDNRPVRIEIEWSISTESFISNDVRYDDYYSVDLAYVDIDGQFTSHEFVISIFTRVDKFDGTYSTYGLGTYWFIINHG